MMEKIKSYTVLLLFLLTGCIMPYDPNDMINDMTDVLVVECLIADSDATFIRLGYTVSLSHQSRYPVVGDAKVRILCDDGTSVSAALKREENTNEIVWGVYVPEEEIHFKEGCKYAVEIIERKKTYRSEFLTPLYTPPIEDVTWTLKENETRVDFHVSTRNDKEGVTYYRWAYEEDWEIKANEIAEIGYDYVRDEFFPMDVTLKTSNNTYYCWMKNRSTDFTIGNTEHLTRPEIRNKTICRISYKERNRRFNILYCLTVKQYEIDKNAYAFYKNLQRNIEETGSVFAPQPTEVIGNIHCVNDPHRPVIGYVVVSREETRRLFIEGSEIPEMFFWESCKVEGIPDYISTEDNLERKDLYLGYGKFPPFRPLKQDRIYTIWKDRRCVDCTAYGTKKRPGFWLNDHY